MCAMGPPSTGKTVTQRFLRHFNILCINEFTDDVMVHIFSKIMLWHLDARFACLIYTNLILNFYFSRGFSKDFDPCIEEIVGATLSVYKQSRAFLLPTPAKSHYLFNLRDFSRVIQVSNVLSFYLTLQLTRFLNNFSKYSS